MLTDAEEQWINAWQKTHYAVCELKPVRILALDVQPFEVTIRKNSVAHTIVVKCDCGATFNATDYESW